MYNCFTDLELWTCLFKRPFPDYFSLLVLYSLILVGCTNHSTNKKQDTQGYHTNNKDRWSLELVITFYENMQYVPDI